MWPPIATAIANQAGLTFCIVIGACPAEVSESHTAFYPAEHLLTGFRALSIWAQSSFCGIGRFASLTSIIASLVKSAVLRYRYISCWVTVAGQDSLQAVHPH
jgi:hypothetical protein